MEITKREIIASISIVSILLILGMFISGYISEDHIDYKERMNKAIKIEDSELFKYSLDTNVGDIMIYGELKALNPVSYPELENNYLEVEKVKEVYTMHTRTITTSNGRGGTTTRVQVYWTWDVKGRESKVSDNVEFCGVKFPSTKFILPDRDYITTIKQSSDVRYKYYGSKLNYNGSILANISENNINDHVKFHTNKSIEEVIDSESINIKGVIFWMIWIIFIGFIVYKFCILDNNWLNY